MIRPLPTRLRAARTTAAVLVAVAVGTAGTVTSADADPLGDARSRATALAATVDRLETQAEVATEQYNAAEAELAAAVTERALAERQLEVDQDAADAAADQVAGRVRALYESGGRTTLLATVLTGSDPAGVVSGLHMVGNLLSLDSADMAEALDTTARAQAIADRLAATAGRVTRLQQQTAKAAGRVRALLDQQQAALASTTAEIRRLTRERQAALAAASAEAFSAALQSAGGSLNGSTTPTNPIAAGAITAARSRLGDPYVWGATGPHSFDCSGLTQWAYAHVGVTLPRVAADQWNAGVHVPLDQLEPGDLLFWATDVSDARTIHHVAMYVGAGMMLAAPHTGDVVKIQPVYMTGFVGATRPYR